MPDPETSRPYLTQVLESFPGHEALVRRLASENEGFRGLCEDLALARTTLDRLSALADTERNAAILSDYRSVVADLENDIAAALRRADAVE